MTSLISDNISNNPSVKRHRRKLSKEPPKSKKHLRPRASSTPPSSGTPGSLSFFRRSKQASIDTSRGGEGRGPSLHLGPPPRGNTDAYDDTKEDDTTEWSKQLLSGLSNVHVRTPEPEELPHHDGESPFVLASDRASAIPSAWARQQLAAYLSGSEPLDANSVSESKPQNLNSTMNKLEVTQPPTGRFHEEFSESDRQDQLAQATSASLAAAHGIIDDIYSPIKGPFANQKRDLTPDSQHAIIPADYNCTKIMPSQHQIANSHPQAASATEKQNASADNSSNPNYYDREQDESGRESSNDNAGKTTIVLRYSTGPTEDDHEKEIPSTTEPSKVSSRWLNNRSKNDSSTQIKMPPTKPITAETFLTDPSPLDQKNVLMNEMEPGRMDSSSPEEPIISTFGLGSTQVQHQPFDEDRGSVPRSVPDSATFVPKQVHQGQDEKDDGLISNYEKATEEIDLKEEEKQGHHPLIRDEGQPVERPRRPEPHSMDTSTTIEVDRRIPGRIW